MNIEDLIKTIQSLSGSTTETSTSTKQSNVVESESENKIDFNNNYFKSQYPTPLNVSTIQNKNNINNISAIENQHQKQQYTMPQNAQNDTSPSGVNNIMNLITQLSKNQNFVSLLQTILPLFSNNGKGNVLQNLFSANKKINNDISTEEEIIVDDFDISNLIKIDDT